MKIKDYPEVEKVSEDVNQELLKDHNGEKTGWYQVGPQKYLLPSKYAEESQHFLNIKTRPDDVWISTFPRTGTTVTQELVWMVVNNCDFETAKRINLSERSPFLELDLFFHEETKNKFLQENHDNLENRLVIESMSTPAYQIIEDMKSPRVIKTHFPPSLLPLDLEKNKVKVIYLARDPKDVVISFYHLMKLWRTSDYTNTFAKFCQQFQDGLVPWGPFWDHVQEGWERRNADNYLFLFYEDLVKDLGGTIRKVADFLCCQMDDVKVAELADHLDIKNFKNNPSVNFEGLRTVGILSKKEESFIRQGKERGKSDEFTEELKDSFNKWIDSHYEQTDLRFPLKM